VRPLPLWNYFAGKNDFIADEGQHVGCSRNRDLAPSLARQKSARYARQLRQPDALKEVLERQGFTERHEMQLVVARPDASLVVDAVARRIRPSRVAAR